MPVHSTQYLSDYVTYGTLHSYLPTEGSPLPPTGYEVEWAYMQIMENSKTSIPAWI